MGLVTDYLIKLIQRQVDEKGIVVWCDPTGSYDGLAARLTLPGTRVARWNGSYLALRREMDELLNDLESESPPRLLIYVPGDLAAADHALDEFVFAGVVIRPGGQSLPLNTNLEVVARHALKPALGAEKVEQLCERIRKGVIVSLEELDELAEQGSTGLIALVFGSAQPTEVALRFLTDTSHDDRLLAKSALPDLAALLGDAFGVDLPAGENPEALRARLRRHLLITEFRASLEAAMGLSTVERPPTLTNFKYPDGSARQACVQLVRTWRNQSDLRVAYAEAARRVEAEFGLSQLALDWEHLRGVESFAAVDARLQSGLEEALLQQPAPDLVELAEARQSGFWAEQDPNLRARWSLIATAGRLLLETDRIQAALKADPPATAADYIECYTGGAEPWCRMDTLHRSLERLAQNFDFDPHGEQAALERLLAHARRQYSAAVDALARGFLAALAEARFTLGGLLYQTEVFSRHVAPELAQSKTAYVLVDALRFEMARELATGLSKDWQVELLPALATPPTITAVGMAALLPGAERGLALVDDGARGLAVAIGGQVLRERKDRINYLSQKVPGLYEVKLEALAPARRAVREAVRAARFVLVTSQEIDLLGEGDSLAQAREFMDSALGKLARAFRLLAELGVQRIVVAADHGYIFAEELESDTTLPAPGGKTVDLHRRVWIGKGGEVSDEVLWLPVEALNLEGDLELATPLGLAGFPAPGGRAYLHGGMSLQELIVPVLVVHPSVAAVTAEIDWQLVPGSAKLSTRFFSVVVSGKSVGMFDFAPPRVRVTIRAKSRVISMPVAASYGFHEGTGEVEMRRKPEAPGELEPNTVTLMLTADPEASTVSVLLEDAAVERPLKKIDVEVTISL